MSGLTTANMTILPPNSHFANVDSTSSGLPFNPLWFLLFILVIPLFGIIFCAYRCVRRAKWERRKKQMFVLESRGVQPTEEGSVELQPYGIDDGTGTGVPPERMKDNEGAPRLSHTTGEKLSEEECLFDPIRDHQEEVKYKCQKGEEEGRHKKIEEQEIEQAQGESLIIADSENYLQKNGVTSNSNRDHNNNIIDDGCGQDYSVIQELEPSDTTGEDNKKTEEAHEKDKDDAFSDASSAHSSEQRMMRTMNHILNHYVDPVPVSPVEESSGSTLLTFEHSGSTLLGTAVDDSINYGNTTVNSFESDKV